jgi:hypothetical protein
VLQVAPDLEALLFSQAQFSSSIIQVLAETYAFANQHKVAGETLNIFGRCIHMTEPEKESEKRQGPSKEAWATIGAVAVALIGGMFTVINSIVEKSPSDDTTTIDQSTPLPDPKPSQPIPISARRLEQSLASVNIDFSDATLRDELDNSFSPYRQFAEGCLKLLDYQRLKKKVYLDVIFWNYTKELGGKIEADSDDGDLDEETLKAAILQGYNTRNGSSAVSFEEILEPAQ